MKTKRFFIPTIKTVSVKKTLVWVTLLWLLSCIGATNLHVAGNSTGRIVGDELNSNSRNTYGRNFFVDGTTKNVNIAFDTNWGKADDNPTGSYLTGSTALNSQAKPQQKKIRLAPLNQTLILS